MRIIFFVIMISVGTTSNSESLFSWLFSSGKEITAEIKLVNKCELDSKYFIVRDLESGKSAPFTMVLQSLLLKLNLRYNYSSHRLSKMLLSQVMRLQLKRK